MKPTVWIYDSSTNDVTGKRTHWACTTSPDRGGAQLCFRTIGRSLNSYIELPETGGQFFCYDEHCAASIRFDDKAAFSLSGEEETSGNTRVMFLPSASRLLASARSASTMNIDAPFFEEGHKVLHFDVSGLDPKQLAQ